MTSAELCKARAAEVGWAQACKEVYDKGFTSAKDYAIFLRDYLPIRDIVTLCRLRFGVGSNQSVSDWTDPEAYRRHKERNRKYYKKQSSE